MEEGNALPFGWEKMSYEDFLIERRKLMAVKIKKAFETRFEEDVVRVNTHITPKGVKLAYIKLVEEEMAEELAVRIGVF